MGISPTQRCSETDEAPESLRAPLLVVVHTPFAAAIAHNAQVAALGRPPGPSQRNLLADKVIRVG
jgi:hypothetical protein